MLCGSAFKNKGVQPLLDAVVDYPALAHRSRSLQGHRSEDRRARALRKPSDTEPLSMIAFKIMSFEHVGSITFCRVYSGKLEQGMALANTTRDKKERAGRMYLMHAADREEIKEAYAGDIVALQGLKDTRTGETLCDPNKPVHPREDGLPRARHRDEDRAQDEGRPGEDGDRAATRSRSRIPRSASPSIRRAARPSSRAWASCISTSRSTS